MPQFAVIDVETTGLSPSHHHRIVEIAVALVEDDGRVAHTWDTLINPQRDVGASEVHGLQARDVYDAPLFEDVAADPDSRSSKARRARELGIPIVHVEAFLQMLAVGEGF